VDKRIAETAPLTPREIALLAAMDDDRIYSTNHHLELALGPNIAKPIAAMRERRRFSIDSVLFYWDETKCAACDTTFTETDERAEVANYYDQRGVVHVECYLSRQHALDLA
jgi:hypothetical protein